MEIYENKCINNVKLFKYYIDTEVCRKNYLPVLKNTKNNKRKSYLDKMIQTIVDRNKGRIIDIRISNNIEDTHLLIYNLLSNNNKIDLIKEKKKKE